MGDGEDAVVTVDAQDAVGAVAQVEAHRRLFFGPGDGAGRWLASKAPASTVVSVHEAKPLADWDVPASE